MKTRKKLTGIKLTGICGCAAVLSLCGCSLAVQEAVEDGENDHLIGAFITSEYLDLYDIEGYLNEHASQLLKEKEVIATKDSRYQQKLYAAIDKGNDENKISDWKVSFGNVEGINFFSPLWENSNGEPCWESVFGESICDANVSVNTSDTGEEHNMTGTIYAMQGNSGENNVYYINPVYQTAEGDIYVTSGDGISGDVGYQEGQNFATTLSDARKTTENGETIENKSNVTINIAAMQKPVKITIFQMNEGHGIVTKEEYVPGELPEKMDTEPGVVYLLVEMEQKSQLGETKISRNVYDVQDEETMVETFYALDDNVVSKQSTVIRWGKR